MGTFVGGVLACCYLGKATLEHYVMGESDSSGKTREHQRSAFTPDDATIGVVLNYSLAPLIYVALGRIVARGLRR